MRKRLLALGLAGIMAASAALTGCSGSKGAAETKSEAAQTEGSEGGKTVDVKESLDEANDIIQSMLE